MIMDEDQKKKEYISSNDSFSNENKGLRTDQSIMEINGK